MVRWPYPPRSEAERRMRFGFERWIEVYWTSAQAWWEQAEYTTMLYETELAEYKQQYPQPTLKHHMLATAGEPRV